MKLRIIHIFFINAFIISVSAFQNKVVTISSDEKSKLMEEPATENSLFTNSVSIPKRYSNLLTSRVYETATSCCFFEESQAGDEVKAYEEFLSGKRAAYTADTVYTDVFYKDILEKGQKEGFFFENLIKDIAADVSDGVDGIKSVQYALIDCGNDNKKQLALRTYGMSFHYPNDDSDFTMVFDWQDENVILIYAIGSWARSCDTLYANGYVSGYGSGGTSLYTREGVIGADGIFRTNYECCIRANGFKQIGMGFYLEPVPIDFYEYTINDETIYAYNILEETTDVKEQIIQNYLRENEAATGVHLLTNEEAWERINKNRKTLGITEEMEKEKNKIVWQELSDENLDSSFSITK